MNFYFKKRTFIFAVFSIGISCSTALATDISNTEEWNSLMSQLATIEEEHTEDVVITADFEVTNVASISPYVTINLDGHNHTITLNLSTETQPVGLFAQLYGGFVQNLTLAGTVASPIGNIGSLCGQHIQGNLLVKSVISDVLVSSSAGEEGLICPIVGYDEGNTVSFENCYLVSDAADTPTVAGITAVTTQMLTSGQLAYMLNGDQSEIVWYQTLGEGGDRYPVAGPGHAIVYRHQTFDCDGQLLNVSYDNESLPDIVLPHTITFIVGKAASCDVAGWSAYWLCKVCHTLFDSQTCENETTLEALTIAPLLHDYSLCAIADTTLASEATCTTDATYYYLCNRCHQKGTETWVLQDSRLGHDFTAMVTSNEMLATAATCTTDAVYYYSCRHCQEKGTETWVKEGSRTGHHFTRKNASKTTQVTTATCTADATFYYTCRDCDVIGTTIWTQTGSKLPHTFAESDHTRSVCTVCNHGFFRYSFNYEWLKADFSQLIGASGQSLEFIGSSFSNGSGAFEMSGPIVTIGESAFVGFYCTGNLTLPGTVKHIGRAAFCNCKYLSGILTLPESLESADAFAFQNCTFTDVVCHSATPLALDPEAFDSSIANTTLHVPSASVDAYKESEFWQKFARIACDSHTTTAVGAYQYCTTCDTFFKDATLSETVTPTDLTVSGQQAITTTSSILLGGNYVVNGVVPVQTLIVPQGCSVSLVLADGCDLQVAGDITVHGQLDLNVQSAKNGKISFTTAASTMRIDGTVNVKGGNYCNASGSSFLLVDEGMLHIYEAQVTGTITNRGSSLRIDDGTFTSNGDYALLYTGQVNLGGGRFTGRKAAFGGPAFTLHYDQGRCFYNGGGVRVYDTCSEKDLILGPQEEIAGALGDVNCDGCISLADDTSLIALINEQGLDSHDASDMNGDKQIDVADNDILRNMLLGHEVQLPKREADSPERSKISIPSTFTVMTWNVDNWSLTKNHNKTITHQNRDEYAAKIKQVLANADESGIPTLLGLQEYGVEFDTDHCMTTDCALSGYPTEGHFEVLKDGVKGDFFEVGGFWNSSSLVNCTDAKFVKKIYLWGSEATQDKAKAAGVELEHYYMEIPTGMKASDVKTPTSACANVLELNIDGKTVIWANMHLYPKSTRSDYPYNKDVVNWMCCQNLMHLFRDYEYVIFTGDFNWGSKQYMLTYEEAQRMADLGTAFHSSSNYPTEVDEGGIYNKYKYAGLGKQGYVDCDYALFGHGMLGSSLNGVDHIIVKGFRISNILKQKDITWFDKDHRPVSCTLTIK